MKLICLSLLLLFFNPGRAQREMKFSVIYTYEDVARVLRERSDLLAADVISLAEAGKIKIYKDSLLKKSYPLKEWRKINFREEELTMQMAPVDPDPTVLIDTTVYIMHDFPFYRHIHFSKNYVHYYQDKGRQFYIDEAELMKALNPESVRFIGVYEAIYNDRMMPSAMAERGLALLRWYALKIHTLAEQGKIKAYKNDSLTSFYKPGEELTQASGYTIVKQYFPPGDTLFLTDQTDTVIFSPFSADNVNAYFANISIVQTVPFTYLAECVSLGPWKIYYGDETYPRIQTYYATMRELKSQFTSGEISILQEVIMRAISKADKR